MHYFFLEGCRLSSGEEVDLAGEDINHAYRVLRLKPGDQVVVSDARGRALSGVITRSEARRVRICLERKLPDAESTLEITLFHSLAKGEKMDLVVRQAVELGVKRIVPVATRRSIPRFSGAQEDKKIQRWEKITRSASAQCRRAFLPPIEPVQEFESILPRFSGHRTLVPWEKEESVSLSRALRQPGPDDGVVLLFIGPEGGFENSEIEAVKRFGAQTVHLGPRIVRTETAALVAVTMVQAAWGDLAGESETR